MVPKIKFDLRITEAGEDYVEMNVLACLNGAAGERGNEQTCRSNKTPCDDDDEDEDQPTDRHSIMCGRGLHKSDKNQRQRATQTKGFLPPTEREGRKSERWKEGRKGCGGEEDESKQAHKNTRGAHVRVLEREDTQQRSHSTDDVILNECK